MSIDFLIQKEKGMARVGVIKTKNGDINTPAFVTVGTKATVKAMTPEMVKLSGSQVVLANTYHLFLNPGEKVVKKAGGFGSFMNWDGPTMTDSGGFQVFSLGEAFGEKVSKVASGGASIVSERKGYSVKNKLCVVDEEGVWFKSHIDGSKHRFTPERSMEIQYDLGADMIFAFDECTSPLAPYEYQKRAMERTHRWAKRSLLRHNELDGDNVQALFGVVQGGRFEDLRKESARVLGEMDFDGYGIGGSFNKEDMGTAVSWVNEILPKEKPRHLLGIGDPLDLFLAVENGCDLFDCVTPTRLGRHGSVFTPEGVVSMRRSRFREDFSTVVSGCGCYTCSNYSKAYLCHLIRSGEMLGGTLASLHNLYFINSLVSGIRESVLDGGYEEYKEEFLSKYVGGK